MVARRVYRQIGNEILKKTTTILKENKDDSFNFCGYIEGNQIMNGDVDVIVTDGFTGNIALKTAEGTANFITKNFKSSLNFNMGLIKNGDIKNKAEHIQIYATNNWKKIYLNLSDLIIPNILNSTFQIYFESDLLENDSEGCVYLDNIKVVY